MQPQPYNQIQAFVAQVLEEDIGRGDLFSVLDLRHEASARILAKQVGILSGCVYAQALAELCHVQVEWYVQEGASFEKGDVLARLHGNFHDLLIVERSFLNILQHSSGIATTTARYIQALNNPRIRILDTRKTRPLLREFEKYSVRNGGGCNHRFGIDDCLMLKDTHLSHISCLKESIECIRKHFWTIMIEVESETLAQFQEAVHAQADIIMCDNMPIEAVVECIAYRNDHAPHIRIEVSGNITLENIHLYQNLEIDAISIGAITHHASFIDLSMKMESEHYQ